MWPLAAWLVLVTSGLNLVRLLMGKFTRRAPELGMQRALGARRRALRLQLLLEAAMVGAIAGVAGVLLASGMMPFAVHSVRFTESLPWLGAGDALTAILVAIGAALLAAAYPAWQLGRGSPASQLRRG